jgi:2-polyprenyl-3-methyl-5-hydroxy-6-metoxy-1,4-benzoquinol methylase
MSVCPICTDNGSKKSLAKVNLIFGTEYDLVECTLCGVIYFEPMPTVSELSTFYSGSYYNFDKSREEGKGMAFANRLMRWKTNGKFLDVGCATGFFINGIRKHSDWEVYGTDFGESAVRFAHEKLGLNVVQGDLNDARFPNEFFDYVHVNNVLEHVLNPVSLLKECRRIIKPDGIFFLSVPNGFNDSLDLIDFGKEEKKPAKSKSGHIFFFHARTLLMLFKQVGFEVETRKTYSLKRGFRSIGYLPRKSNWKKDYFPRQSPEKVISSEIPIPDQKKKHSDLYYKYRFVQGNLTMIPGLHKFGLDFLFILRPCN